MNANKNSQTEDESTTTTDDEDDEIIVAGDEGEILTDGGVETEPAETEAESVTRYVKSKGVETLFQTSSGEYGHAFFDCRFLSRPDNNRIKTWSPSPGYFAFRDLCHECEARLETGEYPDEDGYGVADEVEDDEEPPSLDGLEEPALIDALGLSKVYYVPEGSVYHTTRLCGQFTVGGWSADIRTDETDGEIPRQRRMCKSCRKRADVGGEPHVE